MNLTQSVYKHLRHLLSFDTQDEASVANYCAVALVRAGFLVWLDEIGNLYGSHEVDNATLCLNAHLDARPEGIGADDRCGIAAILSAVEAEDRPVKVLLTTGEEIGGAGAAVVHRCWWWGAGLCASFDRHGNTDIITHYAGKQLASDEILQRVFDVAYAGGMDPMRMASTSMADAHTFAEFVPAVNIATGFYREHSELETYDRADVAIAADVARRLISEKW